MSVLNQINRLQGNIAASLSEVKAKGVAVPETSTSDNLPALIKQISVGDAVYATGRRLNVVFPAAGWTLSGGVYTQNIAANVTANDKGIAQILLSDDLYTRLGEMDADENVKRVVLQNGSVLVELAELPEVDLTLEISIINGLSASSKAALMCLDAKPFVITLEANAWTQSGDSYTQTVTVDGLTDGIVFGDILLNDDDSIAENELIEVKAVTKFEVLNGSITVICFGYPPEIDLHYFIKLFKE